MDIMQEQKEQLNNNVLYTLFGFFWINVALDIINIQELLSIVFILVIVAFTFINKSRDYIKLLVKITLATFILSLLSLPSFIFIDNLFKFSIDNYNQFLTLPSVDILLFPLSFLYSFYLLFIQTKKSIYLKTLYTLPKLTLFYILVSAMWIIGLVYRIYTDPWEHVWKGKVVENENFYVLFGKFWFLCDIGTLVIIIISLIFLRKFLIHKIKKYERIDT